MFRKIGTSTHRTSNIYVMALPVAKDRPTSTPLGLRAHVPRIGSNARVGSFASLCLLANEFRSTAIIEHRQTVAAYPMGSWCPPRKSACQAHRCQQHKMMQF
jgi:hypothetical protein